MFSKINLGERTMTTELLPCPFCGGEAYLSGFQHSDGAVVCKKCGAAMFDTDAQTAIIEWNKRVNTNDKQHTV